MDEKLSEFMKNGWSYRTEGGGSGGLPLAPSTAAVGQVLAVKTVDENGKPTEWVTAGSTEEWTFTLEDGTTVTKKVVVLE